MTKPTEDDLRRAKDNLERVVTDQQRALGVPDPGGRAVGEFIGPILEKVARGPAERKTETVKPEPLDGVNVTELGSYDWNLRTNEFTARPGSYLPTPEDRVRAFIRFLLYIPDVNAHMLRIGRMCSKHTNLTRHCAKCERREEKYRQFMRQCAVKYEYGKPPAKVISTGATK